MPIPTSLNAIETRNKRLPQAIGTSMAAKYLNELSALVKRISNGQDFNVNLECKHFSSGAALYADERICISLTPAGFAVKLAESSRNELLTHHRGKPFRYFAKGPIRKDIDTRTIRRDQASLHLARSEG